MNRHIVIYKMTSDSVTSNLDKLIRRFASLKMFKLEKIYQLECAEHSSI